MTSDGYTSFRDESELNRKLLLQEELILEVTEAIADELDHRGMLKKDLAEKLGKTKGYVSQILGGGKNLTLRTLADVADALHCTAHFTLRRQEKHLKMCRQEESSTVVRFPQEAWNNNKGFHLNRLEIKAPLVAVGSA